MPSNFAPIRLRHHGDLTPPRPDDDLVAVSAGPSGEAIALWSTPAARASLRTGWRDATPMAARIASYWPDRGPVVEIAGFDIGFPTPAPLPDGRVLVVGARCRWRANGGERNAVVFDEAGQRVAEGVFGDGIGHVYTTSSGEAWVGYFDEGVFGNFGWTGPDGLPIGAGGIVRFGADLSPQWSFPLDTSMASCHALNVDDHAVWACYYTGFPVARIQRDGVRHWSNDAAPGASALMVAGSRCVLVGGYGDENRGRVVIGELTGESFVPQDQSSLDLPPGPTRFVARGNELNVFAGHQWYKVDDRL